MAPAQRRFSAYIVRPRVRARGPQQSPHTVDGRVCLVPLFTVKTQINRTRPSSSLELKIVPETGRLDPTTGVFPINSDTKMKMLFIDRQYLITFNFRLACALQ